MASGPSFWPDAKTPHSSAIIRLAADENLDGAILRGLLRRQPALDVVRIQDAGLSGADDHVVLAWAAREDRVLISHDVATLGRHAWERVAAGQAMPGVFEVPGDLPVSQAIEDLLLIAECSLPREWEGQVRYLPL